MRSGGDASEVGLFGKHGPGSLAKDVSGHVLTSVVHLVSLFQGTSATVVPICILFFFFFISSSVVLMVNIIYSPG